MLLSIWVLFPKILDRFSSGLILELHEIIRVSYAVPCPITFTLFYDLGRQVGVFKLMKNPQYSVFLAVSVLFYQVFGHVKNCDLIRIAWNEKSATYCYVLNCFYFFCNRIEVDMRCGPFPQDFGQIHAKITLHFIKIKRACFIFACVIVLVFF